MIYFDPAEIMDEHSGDEDGRCDFCYRASWPCLSYDLAAEVAELRAREQRVRALTGWASVGRSTGGVDRMVPASEILDALDGS